MIFKNDMLQQTDDLCLIQDLHLKRNFNKNK